LLPKLRDTKFQIGRGGVPNKSLTGRFRTGSIDGVDEPFAFDIGRTGRIAPGSSQRAMGLALLREDRDAEHGEDESS
jgi:hypothetical protein